jgi:hypothetical protein
MKIFGSWKELVKLVFRTDTQEVELQPDSATTYTATRTISLPPGDSNQSLVGTAGSQTLTNKTIVVANNTITTAASGNLTSTELNAALDELQDSIDVSDGNLTTHISDTSTHGTTGDIVGTTDTQALTNKTINADLNTISNIENADIKSGAAIDAAKLADGSVDNTEFQRLGTAGTAGAGNLVTTDGTQTLSGKKLADTTTIVDTTDPTVEVQIASNGTASTKTTIVAVQSANRTITLPDATTTLVGTDASQTLSAKTFSDRPVMDAGVTLSHITTPGATPVDEVFIYSKADNKVYKKGADGLESEIGSGGGSGELNLIDSPDTATNWAVTGTVTVATTTTGGEIPLSPYSDSAIKIDAGSATNYAYYRFTLPDALKNTKLKIEFYQEPEGGYASGDFKVDMYENTLVGYNGTSTRLALSTDSSAVSSIPNQTGKFTCSFDTTSNPYMELRIVRVAGSSHLVIQNVVVGPGSSVQGAIITPWQSYTPTTQGFGTIASVDVRYRRVGSSIEVQGQFTNGTVTASEAQIGLPTGLTLTGPSGAVVVGKFDTDGVQSDNNHNVLSTSGDTFVNISRHNMQATATNMLLPAAGNTFATSSTRVAFFFSAPVAEWAGSGVVNLGQNDVEYASTSGTWDAASSTTVFGPRGTQMGGALTASRIKTITWQSPAQADDVQELELSFDGTAWFPAATSAPYALSSAGTADTSAGVIIFSTTATTTLVQFQRYRLIANDDAPTLDWSTGFYWRVKKTKAGAAVGFGLATSTAAGLIKTPGVAVLTLADGSNPGTSSTGALADIAGVTVNITTTRTSRIAFALATSARNNTAAAVTYYNILVNGVTQFGARGIYNNQDTAGYFYPISLSGISAELGPGTYTVKLQARVSAGTLTLLADSDSATKLSVWEV